MTVYPAPSKQPWIMNGPGRVVAGIFFLAFLFFLNFLARVLFSPVLPLIKTEFSLNNTLSGSLFFFISSGYFISVSMSGLVSSRINHANTIFFSACAVGCALLVLSYTETFAFFALGLFFLGLAAGLYLPSGLSTIFSSVPASYLARGLAIHELAPNFSFLVAPVLWQILSNFFSWRQCLLGLACTIILTGFFYNFSTFPLREQGIRPDPSLLRQLFSAPKFWLLVFFFLLCHLFNSRALFDAAAFPGVQSSCDY